MKRSLLAVLSLAVLASVAAPLAAQRPESGDWSVGVLLFESGDGDSFTAGRMFTDRLHGALEFTWRKIDAEDRPSNPTVGVRSNAQTGEWLLGPTVRFYGAQRGPVVPYLRAKFGFGNAISDFNLAGEQIRDQDTWTWQGSASIGAEWFPVDGVGLSAHTGFRYSHESLERFNNDGDLLERTTKDYGVFTSGLTFSFYFQ